WSLSSPTTRRGWPSSSRCWWRRWSRCAATPWAEWEADCVRVAAGYSAICVASFGGIGVAAARKVQTNLKLPATSAASLDIAAALEGNDKAQIVEEALRYRATPRWWPG